ncbi:Pyrophosphate--fructose 6-phosphate 1-phosphotransferase subunit beta 1 [Hibiscus syriacus]|uniref:Pyrophosphate--fructose 6-phosphate 1-phosphotransferase subunit beta 1 n=1 Tax=Hibiscus syriacus TaxID=106335 RepID=A0A6A3CJG6_HIBSY|nr:Pyrophosphate--fructose 6-phosphate 1-phosphotransferase subunit beta 1 [Hibiscus syriacus]
MQTVEIPRGNLAANLRLMVLRSKNKISDPQPDQIQPTRCSYVLRSLYRVWNLVHENVCWSLGDGRRTKSWTEAWIPGSNHLIEFITPNCHINLHAVVRDFVGVDDNWNLPLLRHYLDDEVIMLISAIPPLGDEAGEDKPRGVGIAREPVPIRSFIWLVLHQRLMTNSERCRRGIAVDHLSQVCATAEETIIHVLRDCTTARMVWQAIVPDSYRDVFFSSPLVDRLRNNLSHSSGQVWSSQEIIRSTLAWAKLLRNYPGRPGLDRLNQSTNEAAGGGLILDSEGRWITGFVRNIDEIAKLFPNQFGQPSAMLVPNGVDSVGTRANGSKMIYLFIWNDRLLAGAHERYMELSADYIYPYRNQGGFDMICSGRDKIETPEQFKQAEETAAKLDLDGLVVIGGDDSNTNACLLAENFRGKNLKTRVIGCPKTIDGDLKCKEIYAEMIGNVMIDARSTGKYYHYKWLVKVCMGYVTLIGYILGYGFEDYMVDVICKQAELGYNYGAILIPEGLIDFIPKVQQLIAELNEILAHDIVDEDGQWKRNLLISLDEGRCGLPTNFDASYCYALGYGAGALPHSGKTGLISSVGNLCVPVEEWTVGGTALTSMMDVERRHGSVTLQPITSINCKFKPVIKKAMVELDGKICRFLILPMLFMYSIQDNDATSSFVAKDGLSLDPNPNLNHNHFNFTFSLNSSPSSSLPAGAFINVVDITDVIAVTANIRGHFPQSLNFTIGSDVQKPRLVLTVSGSYSILPAILAGLLGAGIVETAYADADEVNVIRLIIKYMHVMSCSILIKVFP